MQLDAAFGDTLLGQEVLNLDPLVTLKLDDFTDLLIFDEGTVASEFLLESLEELPRVVFLGEALQGCQRLATISLLDTDMDVTLLASYVLITKLLSFVCKRVDSFEVLYVHAMVRFEVVQRVARELRRLKGREERCGFNSNFPTFIHRNLV